MATTGSGDQIDSQLKIFPRHSIQAYSAGECERSARAQHSANLQRNRTISTGTDISVDRNGLCYPLCARSCRGIWAAVAAVVRNSVRPIELASGAGGAVVAVSLPTRVGRRRRGRKMGDRLVVRVSIVAPTGSASEACARDEDSGQDR